MNSYTATKQKNKVDFTKFKICASKDIIKKWKDNIQNRKGYLQMIYLTRVRIYKNSYNSTTTKKTNTPIFKLAKYLYRHFSKEDIQMAKKYKKNAQYP